MSLTVTQAQMPDYEPTLTAAAEEQRVHVYFPRYHHTTLKVVTNDRFVGEIGVVLHCPPGDYVGAEEVEYWPPPNGPA